MMGLGLLDSRPELFSKNVLYFARFALTLRLRGPSCACEAGGLRYSGLYRPCGTRPSLHRQVIYQNDKSSPYFKTMISLHLVVGFLLLKSCLMALAKTLALPLPSF